MASKASGGSSGSHKTTGTTTNTSSNSGIGKGVDMFTDKTGYGDKYDSKITKGVESAMKYFKK